MYTNRCLRKGLSLFNLLVQSAFQQKMVAVDWNSFHFKRNQKMSYYSIIILISVVACWKEGRAIILQEKGRICMDSKMSKAVVSFSLKKSCMGWLGGHCFLEEFILLAHSLPFLFFPCLYKYHPTITTLPAGRHW